ncbi:hypothetical protein, partial [Crocosphaera sp.]|uniref:hypothetical protein n=1 Tax=Crocosphaera sp. TaxID=2729996 RepID=UPI003F241767
FYSRGRSVSDSRVISDGNSSHADLWVFFLGKYSVGLLAEEAKDKGSSRAGTSLRNFRVAV